MESVGVPETDRLFLKETLLFSCMAKVVHVQVLEGEECLVYLDKTVFHPQGGGQPNDQGHLLFQGRSLQVTDLVLSKEHQGIGHKLSVEENTRQALE